MSEQTQKQIEALGQKFFPHLMPKYQVLSVLAVLKARGFSG